jgi:hypothetical protein
MTYTRTPCRSRRWLAGLAAGAALLAPALAGCAAAVGHGAPTGSDSIGSAGGANAASKAGAFSSGLSVAQQKAIYDAQGLLIKRCMNEAGFRYTVPPFTPVPGTSGAVAGGAAALHVNTRDLRAHGYGLYPRGTSAAAALGSQANPDASYLQSLPARQQQRYQEASFGTRTVAVTLPDGKKFTYMPGGCVGRAEAQVYGNVNQYNTLLVYDADIYAKVENDVLWSAAWKSAEAVWSRCMAAHEYHYMNELAAEADISNRYAAAGRHLARVHRYEMRVAAQDATCTGVARLNQVSAAGMRAAAAALTNDQAAAALTWNRIQAHAVAVADR